MSVAKSMPSRVSSRQSRAIASGKHYVRPSSDVARALHCTANVSDAAMAWATLKVTGFGGVLGGRGKSLYLLQAASKAIDPNKLAAIVAAITDRVQRVAIFSNHP
ncbi:hypothetical protein [Noviherbaspirillum cavernae]|uniref:hypothetical protein n=1 Tax=Noviherbaspirillum cavernae TaxID=2320862 RepID=UPI0011C4024B|nr:hypothetical protein [Noviherbaspirillum cavernae]